MGVFILINFVLFCLNSSAAASFTAILSILAMWLLVSLPLCFIGAFFGFRQQVIRVPTRTNQIPRQVPPQACYTRTLPSMLLTGLLPFGCIFIQLFFIFNSIWGQQLFFMFGFLFLVFVFLLVCIIETTILNCYFQLCAEVSPTTFCPMINQKNLEKNVLSLCRITVGGGALSTRVGRQRSTCLVMRCTTTSSRRSTKALSPPFSISPAPPLSAASSSLCSVSFTVLLLFFLCILIAFFVIFF